MQERRKSRVEFLLRLRRQQESLARHALAGASCTATLARAETERLGRTLDEYDQAGRAALAEGDSVQLRWCNAQASRLRDARGIRKDASETAQRELSQRRRELLEQVRRRKAIEHLRNRLGQQLISRQLRRQTGELDEMFTNHRAFSAGATF